jgi:hypothetical protein
LHRLSDHLRWLLPFLEFARPGEPVPSPRALRGSQPEFWQSITEMQAIASVAGLGRAPLPSGLLNVGPCPGLWRVYYTAVSAEVERTPLTDGTGSYLGRAVRASRRDGLGTGFESWVEEANHAMNRFLDSGGQIWAHFEGIQTPAVREFYVQRATELARVERLGDRPERFRMTVPALIQVFPELPFAEMNPDGMFRGLPSGAVFESKLSDPGDNFDLRSRMAAYAVSAEKASGALVDRGIVLHSSYPSGDLRVRAIQIADADVQRVRANLDRLLQLVRLSWVRWRNAPHGKGSGSRPQTWRQLLVRPKGEIPGVRTRGACSGCDFRELCWREGRWNREQPARR